MLYNRLIHNNEPQNDAKHIAIQTHTVLEGLHTRANLK